ncbi:MAG: DNA alkylation repair protein [Marinifilaceae bacterium]
MIKAIIKELKEVSNKKKVETVSRFFKTGKGEYGEGDIFVGINVPNSRILAKKYAKEIDFVNLQKLISSQIHEYRLTALLIIVEKFNNEKQEADKKLLIDFYLSNTQYINNWDLVDLSCYKTLGIWLLTKDKDILFELAHSKNIWEQRIAIITCLQFIKNEQYDTFLKIAELLLHHPHDLIHKAIGWLLRELGKKNVDLEKTFLKRHYNNMPRTMLRYSIEKFPEDQRQDYLKGRI